MTKRGLFITLEGTDGVGKTTHAMRLKTWLKKHHRKVTLTREPGGGNLSEKVREILLNPKTKIADMTELFLYETARCEHVRKTILPALKTGHVVICDRYTDATIAYQGYARKLPLKIIEQLNHIATGGLKPHLTILLELPPAVGLKKARGLKPVKKGGDRLENEGLPFQIKVRKGYLALAKKDPRRIKRVAVQNSIEATQALIRTVIKKHLK